VHRRTGYRQALLAAVIAIEPELERLGYFTLEGGQAAIRQLLALRPRPSAVFAASDEMACGAIRAIRRAGLTVAADVAMIGFDDHATAEVLDLSSVRQPVTEQGVRFGPCPAAPPSRRAGCLAMNTASTGSMPGRASVAA
jgi:LacI family repressor for deo operon, udp, cdd, tsx, nupC, and nupG